MHTHMHTHTRTHTHTHTHIHTHTGTPLAFYDLSRGDDQNTIQANKNVTTPNELGSNASYLHGSTQAESDLQLLYAVCRGIAVTPSGSWTRQLISESAETKAIVNVEQHSLSSLQQWQPLTSIVETSTPSIATKCLS